MFDLFQLAAARITVKSQGATILAAQILLEGISVSATLKWFQLRFQSYQRTNSVTRRRLIDTSVALR